MSEELNNLRQYDPIEPKPDLAKAKHFLRDYVAPPIFYLFLSYVAINGTLGSMHAKSNLNDGKDPKTIEQELSDYCKDSTLLRFCLIELPRKGSYVSLLREKTIN